MFLTFLDSSVKPKQNSVKHTNGSVKHDCGLGQNSTLSICLTETQLSVTETQHAVGLPWDIKGGPTNDKKIEVVVKI